MKYSRFTLIELLMVITICAVLFSLLLGSVSKVREVAKSAICMNNLKNISLATINYTLANRLNYPAANDYIRGYSWDDAISAELGTGLTHAEKSISPYGNPSFTEASVGASRFATLQAAMKPLLCPADHIDRIKTDGINRSYSINNGNDGWYGGVNGISVWSQQWVTELIFIPVGKVTRPSNTLMIGEKLETMQCSAYYAGDAYWSNCGQFPWTAGYSNHVKTNYYNWALCDGSVLSLPKASLGPMQPHDQ